MRRSGRLSGQCRTPLSRPDRTCSGHPRRPKKHRRWGWRKGGVPRRRGWPGQARPGRPAERIATVELSRLSQVCLHFRFEAALILLTISQINRGDRHARLLSVGTHVRGLPRKPAVGVPSSEPGGWREATGGVFGQGFTPSGSACGRATFPASGKDQRVRSGKRRVHNASPTGRPARRPRRAPRLRRAPVAAAHR